MREWQRTAIRHIIVQRDTLDSDIWQMNNRRNNPVEMEQEEKKRSGVELSGISAKNLDDTEKSRFIEFGVTQNKINIEDLRHRIQQKDIRILAMEQAREKIKKCLTSYSKVDNPRLPVMRYIRGLFFDMR